MHTKIKHILYVLELLRGRWLDQLIPLSVNQDFECAKNEAATKFGITPQTIHKQCTKENGYFYPGQHGAHEAFISDVNAWLQCGNNALQSQIHNTLKFMHQGSMTVNSRRAVDEFFIESEPLLQTGSQAKDLGLSVAELNAYINARPTDAGELLESVGEWSLRSLLETEPHDQDAALQRTEVSILLRQGQREFRQRLIECYEGRCAITEYNAEPALEAAHIYPYGEGRGNYPKNGMLLRADIHSLFDRGLIAVDTSEMKVVLADCLHGTAYDKYNGKRLHLPVTKADWPRPAALDVHRQRAGL